MTFPLTPLLDAFDRADENPLSGDGKWSSAAAWRDQSLILSGNRAMGQEFGGGSIWHEQVGSDFEVYATLIDTSGFVFIYATVQEPSTEPADGYLLQLEAGSDLALYRRDDTIADDILSLSGLSIGAGDGLGLRRVGNDFTVWHKPSLGSWTQLGTVATDSAYPGPLHITLSVTNSSMGFDDFGGGTLVTSTAGLVRIGSGQRYVVGAGVG